jgi:hypothetical protein
MFGDITRGADTIRIFSNDFAFTEEKCSKRLAAMFCCIPGKIESSAYVKAIFHSAKRIIGRRHRVFS